MKIHEITPTGIELLAWGAVNTLFLFSYKWNIPSAMIANSLLQPHLVIVRGKYGRCTCDVFVNVDSLRSNIFIIQKETNENVAHRFLEYY